MFPAPACCMWVASLRGGALPIAAPSPRHADMRPIQSNRVGRGRMAEPPPSLPILAFTTSSYHGPKTPVQCRAIETIRAKAA
jgi:hypothetical protein